MVEILTETPADKALLSPAEQQINLPAAVAPFAAAPAAAADQAAPALATVEVPELRATPANQPDDDAKEWQAAHQEKLRVRIARHGATAADLGSVGVDPRNALDDGAFSMVRPHLQKMIEPYVAATQMPVVKDALEINKEAGLAIGSAARKVVQGYLDVSAELGDVLGDAVGWNAYLTWDENNDISISFGEKPDNYESLTLPKWFSEPSTDAGKIGEGILQFAGNMALLNAGTLGTIPMQWVKWTAIGTLADGMFDPKDGGFSTMLLAMEVEPNAVLEFLDPNVTENSTSEERLVGRLKLMIEGAGLGFGIDVAGLVYRGLRAVKNNPEMAKQAIEHLQMWNAARDIKGGEVEIQPGPRTALEGPRTALEDTEQRVWRENDAGQRDADQLFDDAASAGQAASDAGRFYIIGRRLDGMVEDLMGGRVPGYQNLEDFVDDTLGQWGDTSGLGTQGAEARTVELLRDKVSEALNYNFDPRGEYSLEQIVEGIKRGIDFNTDPTVVISQMAARSGGIEEFAQADKEIIPSDPRAAEDIDQQGFYSAASRASQNMPQKKGTPDQMRKMLLSQTDVKPEELAWTGLDEFFAKAKKEKRQVTAKEIEAHLLNNRIDIEVVDDQTMVRREADEAEVDELTQPNFTNPESLDVDEAYGGEYLAERAAEYADEIRADPSLIGYGGHVHSVARAVLGYFDVDESLSQDQLEAIGEALARSEYDDAPTFRITDTTHGYEIVGNDDMGWSIRKPDGDSMGIFNDSADARAAVEDHAVETELVEYRDNLYGPEFEEYTVPGGDNYREILFKFNSPHGNFRGGHFDEGEFAKVSREGDEFKYDEWDVAANEHPNVLAHARVKDRQIVMHDGTTLNVLGIEEIQTDWHKAVRIGRLSSPTREGGYERPRYHRRPERPIGEVASEYHHQTLEKIIPILDEMLATTDMGDAEMVYIRAALGVGARDNVDLLAVAPSPWQGKDQATPLLSGLGEYASPNKASLGEHLDLLKAELANMRAYESSLDLKLLNNLHNGPSAVPGLEEARPLWRPLSPSERALSTISLSKADEKRILNLEAHVAQLWIWRHIPDDVLIKRRELHLEHANARGFEGGYSARGSRPDAPWKSMDEKGWPKLVMRRLVREAAEKGYDAITWTTGQTQKKRYNAPSDLYDKTIPKVIKAQIIKKHDKDAKIEDVLSTDLQAQAAGGVGVDDRYGDHTFKMMRITEKMRASVKRFGNAIIAAPPLAVGAGAAIEQQQQQQQ
tara:strand:+ start:6090 stop:9818 length:3729 start_codon:yes stop_codon:yes gene_type:complete